MKPIWYFVGLMLFSMGVIITLTGIYYFINPSALKTVLGETHPSIWWGSIMIAAGALFYWKNRNVTVE